MTTKIVSLKALFLQKRKKKRGKGGFGEIKRIGGGKKLYKIIDEELKNLKSYPHLGAHY